MDKIYYIIGFLSALISGAYLIFQAMRPHSGLWRSARAVYTIIGIALLYHAVIYNLVIFGILQLSEYGAYLHPVVSVFLVAPAMIAITHRRGKV